MTANTNIIANAQYERTLRTQPTLSIIHTKSQRHPILVYGDAWEWAYDRFSP